MEGTEWVARCPAPAYAVDADGSIVAWNGAAVRLLAWVPSEVLGGPVAAFCGSWAEAVDGLHADLRTGDQRGIDAPGVESAGVGPDGIDVEVQRPDGSVLAVHIDAAAFLEPDGTSVVVGVMAEQRAATAATDAARREAERLRALMHNVSDTITVLDPAANVVFLGGNPGGTLGYRDEDLEGVNALDHLHPDDLERIATQWAELLATPGGEVRTEFRAVTATGGWEYADATAINLLDDPLIGGVLLTSRNITDRKRDELLLAAQASTMSRLIGGAPTSVALHGVLSAIGQLLPGSLCAVVGSEPPVLLAEPVPVAPDGYRAAVEAWAGGDAERGSTVDAIAMWDLTRDDHGSDLAPVLRLHGYTGAWVLPLVTAGGARLLGHLLIHQPTAREPGELDQKVLATVRSLASIAIEHGRAEWLAREALYDSLTGLPNRTLVLDRLRRALKRREREQTVVGLVFFDLDNFKVINDSLGHAAGDDLLRGVARRLEKAVRPGDTVGRLGGDEFVVLCESITDEDVIGVAARLAESFRTPFLVEQTERFATASFGIAVARRADDDPESLLRDADAAMYQAKARGRARYEVFDESMRIRALERLTLETRLRGAAARGEFRVHYQPTIDLSTGTIVGAEALLRWQQHAGRLVPAKDFIGLAESTGVITGLAPWVFREACSQVGRWSADPGRTRPLSVAVNLSARQLADPHLVEQLGRAIDDAAIDPTAICIEMTEGTLMENEARTTSLLAALKDLGVRLAIDDFGVGYSSLSYLKHFPVDVVKVDRSFVEGLGQDAVDTRIVAAVIGLAHSLQLEVVAEGVETEEQHAALVELGCDVGQGHYWSTAVPGPELDRLLADARG